MRVPLGVLVALLAMPLQFALIPVLPLAWGLAAVGLWACRSEPGLRRGVVPSLAALLLMALVGVVAVGLSIGAAGQPVASVGGTDSYAGLISWTFVIPGSLAIMLALGGQGLERALARWAAVCMGAGLLVALPLPAQGSLELGGLVLNRGLVVLLALLVHGFVLAAVGARALMSRESPSDTGVEA
jgi:hypothetical protein